MKPFPCTFLATAMVGLTIAVAYLASTAHDDGESDDRWWRVPSASQWRGSSSDPSARQSASAAWLRQNWDRYVREQGVDSGEAATNATQTPQSSGLPEPKIELPQACLSGLSGWEFKETLPSTLAEELQQVRELIESDQLVLTQPTSRALEFASEPTSGRDSSNSSESVRAKTGKAASLIGDSYSGGADVEPVAVAQWQSEVADHGAGNSQSTSLINPHAQTSSARLDVSHDPTAPWEDPHLDLYQKTQFPSATECAKCHRQIFDEWASSSHAYAAISPMFHKFEQKINDLTQGTIGYFCLRCHAPVATTVGLRRDQPIWDGPRVFREGVTCIACHRVKENYTKSNGERRIEPGDLYDPVYSGAGGLGSQIVAKYADYFKVKTSPDDNRPGQPIHRRAIQFEQISQSDFCMSCHQVAVQPGIKLEVVWDQYRASPAYREGIQCQECHMGIVPGRAEGYSVGPAAVVDGKAVNPERKHSNHTFYGPGYSIAHPGLFPHHLDADRWSVNEWLQFDWRAGWGTEEFEMAVADGAIPAAFPPVWQEPDDRYDARDIIKNNLRKLNYKKDLRRQVMENGSKIDGPFFQQPPVVGQPLRFHYCVQNTNSGHNMPSGSLGAQPQLWLNVVLIGPDGIRIWESGYLDSHGDLADLHSHDVQQRLVPLDKQLFNLQTKFLTTNVKGTDREMFLPLNFDVDQLPFIRPAPQPVSVLNHPPFIRMEAHSIPPQGSRKAKYVVPSELIQSPGTYRLSVRLRSRAEPIYFMKFVDATPEMIRMMNEWIVDAHVQSVIFEVQ